MTQKGLNAAATEYTEVYSLEQNIRPTSAKNRRNGIKRFLTFLGDKPFTIENLRLYVASLHRKKYKTSSVRAAITQVKALSTFLYKRKYMSENIALELIKPKLHKEPLKLISPELVEKVIIAGTEIGKGDRARSKRIKAETKLALRFILRSGIRVTEALKLKGEDLNLDDEPPTFFVNSKGGDIEKLPLPKDLLGELKSRISRKRLFEFTQETANDVLQRGAIKLGVTEHLHVHLLRHIFATSNLKNGIPLQVVSRLMRHKSVEITDSTYSHYDVSDLAFALNNQPIIRQGLATDEVLQNIEQAVKRTGIEKDERFQLEIKRDKDGIVIKCLQRKN